MKITNNYNVNTYYFQAKKKTKPVEENALFQESSELASYPIESLREIYNVKPKKMDAEVGKRKLVRQLNEVLDANKDIDELYSDYMRQVNCREAGLIKRMHELRDEMQDIEARYNQLKIEVGKKHEFVLHEKRDDKIDCALLNKFKNAALEDNFNFEKVYQDYYKDLNNVETVDELTKRYPKIKVPTSAHIVIAERIEDCLTRDFYQKMERLVSVEDNTKLLNFCDSKMREICPKHPKLSDEEYERIIQVAAINVGFAFEKLYITDGINNVPDVRKNKKVQLSDLDVKLVSVDYQDYVLSIMKQMYLEHKNPSAIKYTDGKFTIALSELQGTPHKVGKPSEKIKPFIRAASDIEAAKRSYGLFNDEQLQNRLEFFLSKDIANNEEFLERFVDFASCDLTTKDKDNFIKFLRIMDSVIDGKLSEKEALDILQTCDIKPHETAKKQEAERLEFLENLRIEQQKLYELNQLKSQFDDAINVLYMNEMSGLASACSKYRPETLDESSIDKANFLIDTIKANCSEDLVITAKDKIKTIIVNRNTYDNYRENFSDNELFIKAKEYATNYDGEFDIDKAGSYLRNAEIVQNAPDSLEYVQDKDIVEVILERAKTIDDKVKYLCKLEEYNKLSDKQKTYISEFIDLFFKDDAVEKYILRQIIETKYVEKDTVSKARINDNGDTVDVTISANAKKQILDKYKFPNCLTYLQAFEDGMKMFATDKGSTGIKKTGTNNKALEYKLEIKIMGHDDRLFSKENDYYFDIFSDRGLH